MKKIFTVCALVTAVLLFAGCKQTTGTSDGREVTIPQGTTPQQAKPAGYSSTKITDISALSGTWQAIVRIQDSSTGTPITTNARYTFTFTPAKVTIKSEVDMGSWILSVPDSQADALWQQLKETIGSVPPTNGIAISFPQKYIMAMIMEITDSTEIATMVSEFNFYYHTTDTKKATMEIFDISTTTSYGWVEITKIS